MAPKQSLAIAYAMKRRQSRKFAKGGSVPPVEKDPDYGEVGIADELDLLDPTEEDALDLSDDVPSEPSTETPIKRIVGALLKKSAQKD